MNIVHAPTQHVEADTRYLPKWCSQWTPWQRPPPGNATGTRHDDHADDVVDDSTGGSRHANDARHVCRCHLMCRIGFFLDNRRLVVHADSDLREEVAVA